MSKNNKGLGMQKIVGWVQITVWIVSVVSIGNQTIGAVEWVHSRDNDDGRYEL